MKRANAEKKIAPIFQRSKKRKEEEEDDGSSSSQPREYKIISWNVAGARAWVKKNGHGSIMDEKADLIFLGETKCPEVPGELTAAFEDYHSVLCTSKKNGYAGVALLSKKKPLRVVKGIGDPAFDDEGRLIIAEFASFFFVGAYVPNSGRGLVNLEKRGEWEKLMRAKLAELDANKPVIYGGDLNVAHQEIDLANPKSNANKTAGFTDQEREDFGTMLDAGFVDTFRQQHGGRVAYTFWSFMGGARAKNIGWRLDYFLVSRRIAENVSESEILGDVMGSDHAPIRLRITL